MDLGCGLPFPTQCTALALLGSILCAICPSLAHSLTLTSFQIDAQNACLQNACWQATPLSPSISPSLVLSANVMHFSRVSHLSFLKHLRRLIHPNSQARRVPQSKFQLVFIYREGSKGGTQLREISSCPCSTVLPGPAWVLLSKAYKP